MLCQDGQSRTVRQFQFTDWPEQGIPKSGEGFIDFIGQVHKTKEQFGQEGPITVHCRCVMIGLKLQNFQCFVIRACNIYLYFSAGVGRTGVFVTLSIVLERMRYEAVVDMFQTVKVLRMQRPAMVQNEVRTTQKTQSPYILYRKHSFILRDSFLGAIQFLLRRSARVSRVFRSLRNDVAAASVLATLAFRSLLLTGRFLAISRWSDAARHSASTL